MPVAPSILGGQSWRHNDQGIEATISDRVTGLAQDGSQSCNAFLQRRFQLGDTHPCFTDLVCRDIVGRERQDDSTVYDLEFIFRAPESEDSPGGQFSMAGSLAAAITTRDRTDTQVSLQYTYPANYKDPLLAGQTKTQVPQLSYQRPTQILRWTRLQTSFTTAYSNTNDVIGKINSAPIYSKAAETLLCTRAEIEQANQKWREIFEFQWQPAGWPVYAIFLQEDDNRPIANPDANSEKDVAVYETYNYSLLGLLLPA